jgi:hypothetical protein
MAYFQHGSGIHDVYVYPDNDDPAAGYDDDLVGWEYDTFDIRGDHYEHVGTYDLGNEHDRGVYLAVIGRPAGVNPLAEFELVHLDDVVVVHRRCR